MFLNNLDDVSKEFERLREQWAMQAWGIERTHGDDDPAAKAIRSCLCDLTAAFNPQF